MPNGPVLLVVLILTLPWNAVAQCESPALPNTATTSATVAAGQTFDYRFGERFTFHLSPTTHGWTIEVRQDGRDDNLAPLTPPWHFVPNPRFIEGWHFRNADNTGPNDGSVNAPQQTREFMFSPEVGRTLEYQGRATPARVVDEVARFGRGQLEIRTYTLSPVEAGERARFIEMTFNVCLAWAEANEAAAV